MSQNRCAGRLTSAIPFLVRKLSLLSAFTLAAAGLPLAAAEPAAPAPWEAGPFAADPAAMIQAASQIDTGNGEGGVIVLFSETRYSYDEEGRATRVGRSVYRILNTGAAASWSEIDEHWSPWYQERPQLRARVITPDGAMHALDPATVTEAAVAQELELFEDSRILRAPLPAASPGALVEREVTVREKAPFFDRGTVELQLMRRWVPVRHVRLVVEAPAGLPLRHVVRGLPESGFREETVDGRRRLTFEYRDLSPYAEIEPGLPPDVRRLSYVSFSTAASWTDVARRYSEIVEEAIRKASTSPELQSFLRAAGAPAASQRETIDRLLARLGAEVRYTGVELGAGTIVPRSPAETLRRKFGDCKDKAVLLTTLLRTLNIPAQVALLRAGEGRQEIEESLPGLGAFNHVIVVVPGTPELWIDPTDRYARAGELPAGDEGRLALIASPTSGGLVRIPEATAVDNREIKTREFFLADLGPARVVETTELWGEPERELRASYATHDAKAVRERLTSYVHSVYLSDKLAKFDHSDPVDLASPFRLRLEAEGAKRGFTDEGSAVVALSPMAAMSHLPAELSADKKDDNPKPRQSDYYFTRPFSFEARYRLVAPAGFQPQAPPQGRVRHFGPATLSEEYAAPGDGTLTATLRFDIGKRRLTPAEFQALRAGVREVSKQEAVLLRFDQVGEAHLAAGQVREALAELRPLAALSPKKALPRTRIARALLAGGMGESAREEARRAVALEPAFAPAYRNLAWILQHDELGRRFGKGFDRAGAIAAYRKAKELDPKDGVARADLAILLEHDEKGARYAPGADLGAAIDEYRALRADLDEHAMDDNLLVALLRAGRYAEMKELLGELGASDSRSTLQLVAVAVTESADAAAREAERKFTDGGSRQKALEEAAVTLIQVRRYAEAATLLERASRQAANAALPLARAELLRKTRRHEELTITLDEPANVAKRLFIALFGSGPHGAQELLALLSRDVLPNRGAGTGRELDDAFETIRSALEQGEVPPDVALDLAMVATQETVAGDDAVGYRVTLSTASTGERMALFAVREGREIKLAGISAAVEMLGTEALRRLQQGDLPGARQWLDWAREEVQNAGGDDPLATPPFATLWTQGAAATADETRCAAASLMAGSDESAKAVPLLLACREAAPEGARRTALDLAIALAYGATKRQADLADTARRLVAAVPGSKRAVSLLNGALVGLGRWDEMRQLAEQRLATAADDPVALQALSTVAEHQGKLDEAAGYLQRLADSGKAEAVVFNNLAWLALVNGKVDDHAVENAHHAATLAQYKDPYSLHTLASLYAELGKAGEAYKLILQALELKPGKSPESFDWYVFGRLAEHFGLPEAARRYYARVTPPKPEEAEATSTYRLARQRLAALGPQPPVTSRSRSAR
jgi:tetratricopeptide (TPR) repeat protein/transglutaminase-like putative cysteine protease